jgi:hypothetical protein
MRDWMRRVEKRRYNWPLAVAVFIAGEALGSELLFLAPLWVVIVAEIAVMVAAVRALLYRPSPQEPPPDEE